MIKKPSVQTLNDPTCLNCNFNLPLVSTFDGGAANFAPILFRVSSPKPSKMHLTGVGWGRKRVSTNPVEKKTSHYRNNYLWFQYFREH